MMPVFPSKYGAGVPCLWQAVSTMPVFLPKLGRFNDAGVSYLWQAGLLQQAILSELSERLQSGPALNRKYAPAV
ncbi:hypothetical protein NG798_24755 [Ancylothrix sp. C2]|uniref:hypothetical protein n=1 Tax=Ancylothrix sp. D3o TaxID=2953691 RepID=UPI0021BB39A8|nr:hypothetical protein [Ancylothrix sp. D3o]MCT7953013.1 hypothetical protein [Ancylothrix sp. D3o]